MAYNGTSRVIFGNLSCHSSWMLHWLDRSPPQSGDDRFETFREMCWTMARFRTMALLLYHGTCGVTCQMIACQFSLMIHWQDGSTTLSWRARSLKIRRVPSNGIYKRVFKPRKFNSHQCSINDGGSMEGPWRVQGQCSMDGSSPQSGHARFYQITCDLPYNGTCSVIFKNLAW